MSIIVYEDQEKPPLRTCPDLALNRRLYCCLFVVDLYLWAYDVLLSNKPSADMSCFQGLFFCPEAASLLLHNFCIYHLSPPGHELGAETIFPEDPIPSVDDLADQIVEGVRVYSVWTWKACMDKDKSSLPPSGRYLLFSPPGNSSNVKLEQPGLANLPPFGPGNASESGHFGHGLSADSSLFSNDISRMPDNPPRKFGHRRAHSEITLPDDISFDSDLGVVGLDGLSLSNETQEDIFSMYLDMDKFNSSSLSSEFQVGESSSSAQTPAMASVTNKVDPVVRVEEPSSAETKKAMSAAKLAELALIDPKRAKRYLYPFLGAFVSKLEVSILSRAATSHLMSFASSGQSMLDSSTVLDIITGQSSLMFKSNRTKKIGKFSWNSSTEASIRRVLRATFSTHLKASQFQAHSPMLLQMLELIGKRPHKSMSGIKKEEVKVEVEEGRFLQISGERSREQEEKNDQWHRMERSSGKFLRRFRLPENANTGEIKAAMENEVLTVTLPKEEEKKPEVKAIDISS
ncbi:hypothetical protein RND71_037038 [Anisodus tanguticus]|uniref:SHSP domain-containing protein n=1 Tax=Anisodus tanguticus TaxID=243964 RepID=A0AAE1V0D7_9SOLA|nr:hypothetical protein RND71_037038 [Anisodus tanguticus]